MLSISPLRPTAETKVVATKLPDESVIEMVSLIACPDPDSPTFTDEINGKQVS